MTCFKPQPLQALDPRAERARMDYYGDRLGGASSRSTRKTAAIPTGGEARLRDSPPNAGSDANCGPATAARR